MERRVRTSLRPSWRAAASRFRCTTAIIGVFGVTATIEQYCDDLKKLYLSGVCSWKEAWKRREHGTP